MVRYLTAAVLGCLYIAGSILIVRSAGEAHRDRLVKAKLAPPELDTARPAPKEKKDASNPPDAVAAITPTRPELVNANPPPAPVVESPAKPATEPSSPAPPAADSAKAKSEPSKLASAVRPPPALTPAPANPLEIDQFWKQERFKKVWDVTHLSADEEGRLGDDLHELIVHLNPIVEAGPELRRVVEAAEPFLATIHRREIKYRFFILDSDAVNAFSTPGGYIYVCRGLLDFIAEDEDYALQFAIGHEIAHVDLQHAIICLQDPGVMRMREGTLQKLYVLIIPFGYLEKGKFAQEFDADDWVAIRMQRFQLTRREILVFLTKLDGYAKKHAFDNGRIRPQPGRGVSPLENHYRAQRAAWERLKQLKEFMGLPPDRPK
jgi:hypothetical protein